MACIVGLSISCEVREFLIGIRLGLRRLYEKGGMC